MKIIVIYIQKGGVGKTTTTAMVSYDLSHYGKVLLIDNDSQGNLTSDLCDNFDGPDWVSVLKGETTPEKAVKVIREPKEDTNVKGIDLIGTRRGDTKLRGYYESDFHNEPKRIKEIINYIRDNMHYDYILFDMPPAYGHAEQEILALADEVIPCLEPDHEGMESMKTFNENMKKHQYQYDAHYDMDKLVVNRIDKDQSAHRYFLDLLEKSPFHLYEFNVSSAITSAEAFHLFVQEYMPKIPYCTVISKLAASIK